MASKRFEYTTVKGTPDQIPVAELNKLGTDGYHVVAAVGQVVLLERQVKKHKGHEEDGEGDDEEER